jgi:tetratricopeptide (TPR) repeat protein
MKHWYALLFIFVFSSCQENSTPKLDGNDVDKSELTLDSLNSLIKESPNSAELYFERAKYHFHNRDLASSQGDVGRALKIDSSQTEFYLFLANLKILSKESRDARNALLKAYKRDPKNIEVLLKLGELYMIVEDYAESFKYLNEALELDIHNATAYRLKGFNYKYAGDTVNSVSSFQTAIEQDPDDYDSYLQLGLLFSIPLNPLALDFYDNALRVKPTSLEALYAKALHLQNIGESRESIELYDRIISLNAAFFNAHFNKGYIYLEHLEKFDSAAFSFNNALEFGPKDYYQALYNRGLSYERAGLTEKALADYTATLKINPQYDLAAESLSRLEKK